MIYSGLLAVATILLAISFFCDHDHDFDHSPGAIDGEAPGYFNLRIMSLAMGAFGAFGMIAEWAQWPSPLLVAIVAGLVFAYFGKKVIAAIWKMQGNSLTTNKFVGLVAEVSVDIPADGIGEVYVVAKNGRFTYEMAQSNDGQPIPAGAMVTIITSGKTLTVERKI